MKNIIKSKHIRMSLDQERLIQEKADLAEDSFSSFMTASALNSSISIHPKYDKAQAKLIHHDITQLTSHVNALSTVLNRSLRQNQLLFDSADLDKILTQLTALTLETRKVADKYDSQTK